MGFNWFSIVNTKDPFSWAPGQAMKDKAWNHYWDDDYEVSYNIPWKKLNEDYDYWKVGGMFNTDSMPQCLKTHLNDLCNQKSKIIKIKKEEEKNEIHITEGVQQHATVLNLFILQEGKVSCVQIQLTLFGVNSMTNSYDQVNHGANGNGLFFYYDGPRPLFKLS